VQALRRLFSNLFQIRRDELAKAIVMAGLFFLVVTTIGILKPIKNAFALDGLADSEFYKVYLVSAAVTLFVFPYNRLADRIAWRWLIPSISVFFAANLLIFRALYTQGSTAFGVTFYGWYDIYAAVMVTQFFMATQLFFNARDAKRLYPLAIAGGSEHSEFSVGRRSRSGGGRRSSRLASSRRSFATSTCCSSPRQCS